MKYTEPDIWGICAGKIGDACCKGILPLRCVFVPEAIEETDE